MNLRPNPAALSALALASLTGSPLALAQVPAVDSSDPFAPLAADRRPLQTRWETDYSGNIELGAKYVTDDNFKFGQYDANHEEGAAPIATIDWRWTSGAGQWHFEGTDVLGGVPAARLDWSGENLSVFFEIENFLQVRNHSGSTPFSGSNELALPAGWVSANVTSGFTALADSLQGLDQEIERDRYRLGLSADLSDSWSLDSALQYEEKEGTRDIGAAIFQDASAGQAAILPGNIDYESLEFDLTLNYSGDKLMLSGSWFYSDFDNQDELLTWQNPYNSFGPDVRYPDGIGGLGVAPDNEYNRLRLLGTYRITPTLRLQVDGSYARTEQDQGYADYTVNPALAIDQALPRTSLDGEVNTATLDARLFYRLFRKLNLEAWFHGEEREYELPRDGYRAVPGDGGSQSRSSLTVYNTAHDYSVNTYGIEGSYPLPLRSKLWLAYEYEEYERENAAVEKTEEDRYTLKYRLPLMDNLHSRWEFQYADRSADTYHWDQSYYALLDTELINATPDAQRFINHPLLSQYHLATRERSEAKLDLDWQPGMDWNISANLLWREDDYGETSLGLQEEEMQRIGLSASWLPSQDFSLSAYASLDSYEREQAGRAFRGGIEKNAFEIYTPLPQASDPSRDWMVETEDEVISLGVVVEWALRDDIDLILDYSYVETEADYSFANGGAADLGSEPLPADETEQHHLKLEAIYHVRENLSIRVDYQYWIYEADHWAIHNVAANTIDRVLTLGEEEADEDLHFIGTSIIYRWQ